MSYVRYQSVAFDLYFPNILTAFWYVSPLRSYDCCYRNMSGWRRIGHWGSDTLKSDQMIAGQFYEQHITTWEGIFFRNNSKLAIAYKDCILYAGIDLVQKEIWMSSHMQIMKICITLCFCSYLTYMCQLCK